MSDGFKLYEYDQRMAIIMIPLVIDAIIRLIQLGRMIG